MASSRAAAFVLASVLATTGCTATARMHAVRPENREKTRIVTLMPSFADDLIAIGAGRQVVAVSSFTDAPQAKSLPRVGDAYSVDTERIVALHAGAVVGIPAQARVTQPLRRAGIDVVLLPNDTYASIFSDLRALGALTGHGVQAAAAIERMQHETVRLRARTRAFVRRPSVFVVLGSGPIWTAGAASYIAALIALAGGVNAANDLHAAYGEYSAEALLRAQPDVLVTDRDIHLEAVLGREPWRSLRAVQLHRVYTIGRIAALMRPGPSYNEGIEWLIGHLAPLARR